MVFVYQKGAAHRRAAHEALVQNAPAQPGKDGPDGAPPGRRGLPAAL